ncbi:MAG: T9SS type A sorting domain-containing protein [Bacteroidetes bacterium]|nr:T9SS type A sorting domain-containing protein [Bacteroidota bacterium]
MKKTITFFASLLVVILMGMTLNAQVLLNEHFNYPVGDTLSGHGWVTHSGLGSNTIPIVSGNLSYTGYPSPSGQMIKMLTSGQDVNKVFGPKTSNVVYAAFLVKVISSTTGGDYFAHFMKAGTTTTLFARVFVKQDALNTSKVLFGVGKATNATSTATVYATTSIDTSLTHLIVLKYTANSATTTDDVVSLFIDPTVTGVEGTPSLTATDVATDYDSTYMAFAFRQGTSTSAPVLNIDEVRVASTWADAVGFGAVVTAPVVTTGITTGLTSTSAICAGNVISDGGGVISARGICYGAVINPDITGTKVVVTGTTGAFTGNISGLTAGNTYHYRAYATNSAGTSYGADTTFITPTTAVAPVVTTATASNILSTTATVGGEVINDGGSAITLRGICYGTALNPDTTTKVVVTGTTGVFSGNLTGLTASTLYHARAFAKNAIGLSYGADITFTTQVAGIPCANIAALRLKTADNSTVYELTAEVLLSCKVASRNQKYVQDASGAILIDDAGLIITTTYNVGDGITGIKGKLENYYGLLEFHPVVNTAAATSTGNTITPVTVTALNLQDTVFMYQHQSKLIKLVSLSFTDANGTMKFGTGKKFRMSQTTTTDSLFYCNFYDADYTATATAMVVPSGTGDVTGIAVWSKSHCYITARNKYDVSLLVGVNDVQADKIGIYPNPSNGKFTVNVENASNGEIKIYSLVGSLIYTQQINKANNELDLSSYGKGLYFVQFTDAKSGKSWTEKLIVK